jgi:hypothetical protein
MSTSEARNNLEYIGSVLSSVILLLTMATVTASTLGYANLDAVPQQWLITVVIPIVIMSAIQAFGDDVYRVFQKTRPK